MELGRKMKERMQLIALGAVLFHTAQVQGTDWLVDGTSGNDGNTGSGSWAQAFRTIEAALAAAITPGDNIFVAEGVYVPVVRTNACDPLSVTFELKNQISVYGGFHPSAAPAFSDRDPVLYETVLSGDLSSVTFPGGCPNGLGGDCFTPTTGIGGCTDGACCDAVCCIDPACCSNEWDATCVLIATGVGAPCANSVKRAYHVVTAPDGITPDTIVDGFTIEDGAAAGSGDDAFGGGLFAHGIGNHSSRQSSPRMIRCRFINNSATLGGAAYISGGASEPRFFNCEIVNNTASDDGGGLYVDFGHAILANTVLAFNTANDGAAVYVDDSFPGTGEQVTFINCTVSENTASNQTGGVLMEGNTQLTAINSIFWGNSASSGSTEEKQVDYVTGMFATNIAVSYSCVEGLSTIGGTGNIGATGASDPDFVAPGSGDFSLNGGSPAINTADPGVLNNNDNGYFPGDDVDVDNDGQTSNPLSFEIMPDLLLKTRVLKARLDMGAIEFASCAGDCVTSATFAPPPDGNVDAADLAFLLGEWGTPSPSGNTCADLATSATFAPPGDGNVDAADLALLLGNWGSPCVNVSGGEGFAGGSLPYEGTEIGDLLNELLESEDEEEMAELIEQLLTLLTE